MKPIRAYPGRLLLRKFQFLKGSFWSVAVWPLLSVALCAGLWTVVHTQLAEHREAIEREAVRDARLVAHTYAQNLTRALEQVDQLSLLVKFEWERAHRQLGLEILAEQGVLPVTRYALFTIIDEQGTMLTGNRPFGPNPITASDRDYFKFHRDVPSASLLIGKPMLGRVSGKTVIQFTRRLDKSDGSFDGVVLISVEPEFFTYFYDEASLGQAGLLAVRGMDSVFRAVKFGAGQQAGEQDTGDTASIPAAENMDGALQDGQHFMDGQARFIASERLKQYPLVAIAGLSREERLAGYRQTAASYRFLALVGTVILGLFALAATLLSLRLAWRKHTETEVQQAYRLATEGGNEGFYMLRTIRDRSDAIVDFEVVDCNVRGAALYGMTREEFVGSKSSALNSPEYFPVVLQTYPKAIEKGFHEDELKVPPGSPLKPEWVHRRVVRSGTGIAVTLRDISHIKSHERELSRMANEDALTALPNRNWLRSHLPTAIDEAKRNNRMLALLFVDLDNFKNVNDSLGHSAGDELLHAAALRLRAVVRPSDHVIRLGGDEFTVVLEPISHEDDAAAVAGRIVDAFRHPFDLARGRNRVGASIGISIFPRDGVDAESLLKNSDIAMYHAKNAGKGHYRFYTSSLSENLENRLELERALQQALELNQFELHYQPRVDTRSGELRAVEALVRWRHPERGMVPPVEFIPLAEETGLILPLGDMVLEKACAQVADWRRRGLPVVPVSINVSPRQFNHGEMTSSVTQALARHELDGRLVEIEITESSMIGDDIDVASELQAFRDLGVKLLVDDFGTGYSSLSQLQRFDMDVLKVDRAFTATLGKNDGAEVFIRAIVSMAHALEMRVVAEGVETVEQLEALRKLGCDEVQGYLIARPLPPEQLPALLQQRFLLPQAEAVLH